MATSKKPRPSLISIPKELDFISTLKMVVLILVSMPFWFAPLLLAFVIKAVSYDQNHDTIGFYFSIVPVAYAYGSMLVGFLRIQKAKVQGKLRPVSFLAILSAHSRSLLQLIALQSIDLVLNRFAAESLVFMASLQLYYFFAEITEYFYRKIMLSIPVNQRMIQTWQGTNILLELLKLK